MNANTKCTIRPDATKILLPTTTTTRGTNWQVSCKIQLVAIQKNGTAMEFSSSIT